MSIAARLPILWLTVRQFRNGRSIQIVACAAAVSIILAAIYLIGPREHSGDAFLFSAYFDLLAPTVIPIATLILAASALGNEISDRTMAYLMLKPVCRLRIVLEKYLAVASVTGLAFLIGLAITLVMLQVSGVDLSGEMMISLLLSTASSIFAYGALSLLASLITQRALIAGIMYILLWESILVRAIPAIKALSVRHFAQSIFVQTMSDPPISLPDAIELNWAAITITCLVFASLTLASLRLSRMNLD